MSASIWPVKKLGLLLKRKVKLLNETNEAAAKNKPSIDRVCAEIVGAERRASASRFRGANHTDMTSIRLDL